MSICCAFSFSFLYLSSVEGWDKKRVGLAPLEDITRAFWFPFPEITLPFSGFDVCCWPWVSCFEFPALDQGQRGQALTTCYGLVRAATGALLVQFKNDPDPNLIPLRGLMLLLKAFVCPCHTHRFVGSLSYPEETFQLFFLFFPLIAALSLLRF